MSLRRFSPTNYNSEADLYTSNVTTVPTHNLSGRDSESERPPEYSPTDSDALGVAGTSQGATTNYSKRPFGMSSPPASHWHLCEFC